MPIHTKTKYVNWFDIAERLHVMYKIQGDKEMNPVFKFILIAGWCEEKYNMSKGLSSVNSN